MARESLLPGYSQGQGETTENKLRGISGLCALNLRIVHGIASKYVRKPTYFHFDLHAGSGWNERVGVIGSPLAFLEAGRAEYSNYIAHFIDINEEAAVTLARREEVAPDQRAVVMCADNRELVQLIPDIIREYGDRPEMAYGSVLIDPNGPTGGMPWTELSGLFTRCAKLDCIVNFPANGMKRMGRDNDSYVSINEIPELLSKRYWLIREADGKWQWCLMFGSNFRRQDWRAERFHHWESETGASIRNRCYFTRREWIERTQGTLYG